MKDRFVTLHIIETGKVYSFSGSPTKYHPPVLRIQYSYTEDRRSSAQTGRTYY